MKQWPVNKAYFWETAPFFRLLLPFIAGIIAYSSLKLSPLSACITGSICLIAYVSVAVIRRSGTSIRIIHFVLLHILLFFAAWSICYLNDIRHHPDWFGRQIKGDKIFIARIAEPPVEKEKTWKLKLQLLHSIENDKVQSATGTAPVYVFKSWSGFDFQQGDTVFLPNKWQPVKNAGNPFEFDYSGYSARHNIYYLQFLAPGEIKLYGKANANDLSFTARLHNWCMLQLERYISDRQTLGLMQAMLIGDEANLDTDLRNAYSETGIIHVIAISGSHIAFFFFIITFLLGWIKNKKYHWIKYALALPLIWGYVLMAGAPPSAVRAALMFSILGVGFALQKQHNSLNYLLATAFFLLCAEPMWLYSVGFQLSFLAVLSLIIFYSPIYHLLQPKHIILKSLWAAVVASIAAEILVAPLVIWYFHIFPLMFLVANIAAFLFMGIVLVAGMLIILLSSIPPVAGFIAAVTTWLVIWFHQFVFAVQELNPESFRFLNLRAAELILVYLVIIFTAVYLLHNKKKALLTGLASCCLLLVSLCYMQWDALHQKRLVVYNINGLNHIELVEGKHYRVLHSDSVLPAKANYTLRPAHTGWHAWQQEATADSKDIIQIGSHSVLLLNTPAYDDSTHVDYVILNFKPKPRQLEAINKAFTPLAIVLGSHVSRRQAEICKQLCDSLQIPLHTTQWDGAFVLSAL